MANIYLRVPTYVAQFYRGRVAPEPVLSELTPVEFSPFQRESVIMSAALMLVSEQAMDHTVCFSERMWKNILNGRRPQGGKTQLRRDPQDWPTMDEILFLTGATRNKKTDGFDYLCIATPKTIVVGGQYKQVTSSYTLPLRQANALVKQLRADFLHVLLYWITEEQFACNRNGIRRDVVMCIDHFFYHYQMCLGGSATDRESMRRMAMRWLEDAKMLPLGIDDDDALFVYKKEEQQGGINADEMLANVKSCVNKA